MSISSVMSLGMQGIQAGINRSEVAAGRIAGAGDIESWDLASSMVGLKSSEIQVKASASVVKTGDQILGTLIDIRG